MAINNGVDLAREERLKKCDTIIEHYEKIRVSSNVEKIIQKQKGDDVKFWLIFSFIKVWLVF
jgi:hypothetical protein